MRAALPPAAPAGLEQLLSPVSVQEFEADYWEKRPLHVQRPFPPAYQSLLRGQDLPTLAAGLERQGLEVQAFVDCKRCESHGLLRDFYGAGSVVLNRIDKAWAPLGRLCASLRERLHHVFAVMYLTPRGSQAVPAHTDDQDVFVLQLAGCKHWRVYPTPLALPYSHEQLGKDQASPLTGEMLGNPILELCLRPGELLYLPRGAPHEARADEGASSLHVTLTAQTSDLTWAGLVLDGLQELHRGHAPFRHALPIAMLSGAQGGQGGAQGGQGAQGEGLEAQWQAQWQELMRHSAERSAEAYGAALRRLHAKIAKHNAEQDAALRLLARDEASSPTRPSLLEERLQRTPDLEVEMPEEPPPGTPAGGYAKLIFRKVVRGVPASMELSVAHAMLPAMRFIASERRPSFYASELPGVDECEQVALVVRLLEASVLEVFVPGSKSSQRI